MAEERGEVDSPEVGPAPIPAGATVPVWNRFAVILIWAVATVVLWRTPPLLWSLSSILALVAALVVRDRLLIAILAIASLILIAVPVLVTGSAV